MSDYTHILVAIDFSHSADLVLAKAKDITERNTAKLSILHVVEFLPPIDYLNDAYLDSSWIVNEKTMVENAKQNMLKLIEKHSLTNSEYAVELGVPKIEISQYIATHQCDLVVMGSHGRHGIKLLLGSTANAVLHDMPCDILTIKLEK